jgi:hypothetical protein
MPGKQKKKSPEAERQEKVRDKRKDSGLRAFTIYLDELTKKKLEKLCLKNGYNKPIEDHRSDAHALSNTIGAIIRKTGGVKYELSCSNVKAHQELYNLQRIAFHRKKLFQEDNTNVAKFMETYGYPRPCVVAGTVDADKAGPWSKADIGTLTNMSKLKKLIEKGKEKAARKAARKAKAEAAKRA